MREIVLGAKVSDLKEAFDQTFAQPLELPDDAGEDLIAVQVGSTGYALRLKELSGIQKNRRIVPLPGGPAGFRGLAGIRGRLVAVHSLSALLGERAEGEENWLALTQGEVPIGLAFASLDGFLRESTLFPAQERASELVREVLRVESVVRGVIHVPSVVEAIKRRITP